MYIIVFLGSDNVQPVIMLLTFQRNIRALFHHSYGQKEAVSQSGSSFTRLASSPRRRQSSYVKISLQRSCRTLWHQECPPGMTSWWYTSAQLVQFCDISHYFGTDYQDVMWSHVFWQKCTKVSDEYAVSIFRVKEFRQRNQIPSKQ
jgi:hypothetical protein